MGPIVAILLSACAVLQGDGSLPLPWSVQEQIPKPEPGMEPPPSLQGRHAVLHGTARARASFPLNSMDAYLPIHPPGGGLSNLSGSFKWSDFFGPGLGGSLDLDLIWEDMGTGDAPPPGDEWAIGAFASVGFDRFQGRKVTDSQGASVEPDELQLLSFLIGPKLVKHFPGGCFLDARFGLGAVHYSQVDAGVQTAGIGAQNFEGEFFKNTVTFALQVDVHAGLWIGRAALVVGGEFRLLARPDGGRQVEMSTSSMLAFAVDFGAELAF